MTLYHVTRSKLLPRILKQGLKTLQTSNWVNGNNQRLGGGAVFAFEAKLDALRWATLMDWEMFQETGSGKITIITFESKPEIWDTDFADPLRQCGSVGQWRKTFEPIPAGAITGHEAFEGALVKQAFDRANKGISA